MKPKIIAIDFDGTCTTDEFPKVGKSIGAEVVLKDLVDEGHKLILWTVRSGRYLTEAVEWFKRRQIPLYGVNQNPQQRSWSNSPKAFFDLSIDDRNLGAPLIYSPRTGKGCIDWEEVRAYLVAEGYFSE